MALGRIFGVETGRLTGAWIKLRTNAIRDLYSASSPQTTIKGIKGRLYRRGM